MQSSSSTRSGSLSCTGDVRKSNSHRKKGPRPPIPISLIPVPVDRTRSLQPKLDGNPLSKPISPPSVGSARKKVQPNPLCNIMWPQITEKDAASNPMIPSSLNYPISTHCPPTRKRTWNQRQNSTPSPIRSLFPSLFLLPLTLSLIIPMSCASPIQPYSLLPGAPDPPCHFNPLCTCSKPGPDLGKVSCIEVEFPVLPATINTSAIYMLTFSSNSLRKIEPRSFYGTGISRLELTHNLLTSSALNEDLVFSGLERTLRELNLQHNRLTSIPRFALHRMQRLKELNLNQNHISDVRGEDFPPNCGGLKALFMAGNSLTYLDQFAFKSLVSLQQLDLGGNNIFSLHPLTFARLPDPPMDYSSASSLSSRNQKGKKGSGFSSGSSSSGSSSLEYSSHSDTSLLLGMMMMGPGGPEGHVTPLPALHTLILVDNRLKALPLDAIQNLTTLKVVDLRSNLISATADTIDYKGRKLSLNELHLDHNRIDCLPEDAFENFVQINELYLGHNPIKIIEDNAFRGTKVSHLDLRGCEIEEIAFWAWTGLEKTLKSLDLSENRLLSRDTNDVVFYNDSFNNLESLSSFRLDNNQDPVVVSPLSLLSSQYSLQDISLKGLKKGTSSSYSGSDRKGSPPLPGPSFDPVKYEMYFPAVRSVGLSSTSRAGKVTRTDLVGFGNSGLEDVDLSDSDLDDILDNSFESTPSLKRLNLSRNRIRRVEPNAFKAVGRSLLYLDLSSGLRQKVLSCEQLFDHLHSLIQLNLMNNDIESLSSPGDCFRNMQQLKVLVMDFNHLKAPLKPSLMKPLTELVVLSLSFNQIGSLDPFTFNELDSLETIDLSHNQITKVGAMAFANLRSLRRINLQGNDLETIEGEAFYYLPKMERLNLSFNRLHSFSLSFLDQVGTLSTFILDTSHNMITGPSIGAHGGDGSSVISVKQHQREDHPNLHHHNIIDLEDADNEDDETAINDRFPSNREPLPPQVNSLEVLNMSHNNLTHLNGSFLHSIRNSLSQLILHNNLLGNLTSTLLSDLKHLQRLDLRNNLIESIPPDTLMGDISLQIIDLGDNRLTDLLQDTFLETPSLRILKINGNKIRSIPETLVRGNKLLESLYASRNLFSYLPLSALSHVSSTLRHVDFGRNNIRSLLLEEDPSYSFPRLLTLDLSHNMIKSLTEHFFTDFPQLQHLDLSFNPIRVLSDTVFDGISATLDTLDLAGASLKSIPMLNLPDLKVLNLSINMIYGPNSISFTNISDLQVLDISSNRLNVVPNNLWGRLRRLRSLDISGNPITSLGDESFLGLDQLERLQAMNLTRLAVFSPKALDPLFNLQSLTVSTYPSTPTISALAKDLHSLREVTIYLEHDNPFPPHHPSSSSNSFGSRSSGSSHANALSSTSSSSSSSLLMSGLPHKLSHLRLHGNQLKQLDQAAFSDLNSNTFDLSITGTNLSWIQKDLFSSLSRTTSMSLDVSNNGLTSLPDILSLHPKKGFQLNSLKLAGNPWSCDCKLVWVREWLKHIKAQSMPLMGPLSPGFNNRSSMGSVGMSSSSGSYGNPFGSLSFGFLSNGGQGAGSMASMGESSSDGAGPIWSQEDLLQQALTDVRDGKCIDSGKSLLDVFRKELQDCRSGSLRGHSPSISIWIVVGISIIWMPIIGGPFH